MDPRAAVRVERAFYDRDTTRVARELLGQRLVSMVGGARVAGRIVETEAYVRGDSTNHAARGKTARNAPMFAQPGVAYVYLTYGMHHCLNLVTEEEGSGTAVLLRAVEILEGGVVVRARRGDAARERDLCRGPGRLCVALGVDLAINGRDTCADDASVFVEMAEAVDPGDIVAGPRVGVVGTREDVGAPLRFHLRGSLFVSDGPRPPPARPASGKRPIAPRRR